MKELIKTGIHVISTDLFEKTNLAKDSQVNFEGFSTLTFSPKNLSKTFHLNDLLGLFIKNSVISRPPSVVFSCCLIQNSY